MNKKIFICSLPLMLLLCVITPMRAFAETRNIYIGDIITLQIASREFSAAEIAEKFQDFEIIEIKEERGGYFVSLRTFETGEHKILLGGKEIILNVRSTLEDISRDGIFEGTAQAPEPWLPFYWLVIFCVFAGIFILSGAFILFKKLIKRKKETKSPRQLFLCRAASLPAGDKNYFVDLTYYFKEYLEALYKFKIIGKTSAEIINELKETQITDMALSEIREWVTECDRLKFTGIDVQSEEKQGHYKKLIDLVDEIDTQKEGME